MEPTPCIVRGLTGLHLRFAISICRAGRTATTGSHVCRLKKSIFHLSASSNPAEWLIVTRCMNTQALPYSTEAPTALVVEDELSVRELICEVLQDEGIRTVPLETIDEGLAYLESHASDLSMMVLDVRTPGLLDGLQLAAIAERRWPDIPVLLTSGFTGSSASIPKCATFLSKPWTIGAFIQAVHSVMNRGKPANDD